MPLVSPPLDAHPVAPNLWVGARPRPGQYRWFNVIVLAAREYQPPSFAFPGSTVIHVPLDDTSAGMTELEQALAISNAKTIVRHLRGGQRVLSTCQMGLNRSSLLAALAMILGSDATTDEAIAAVRAARGDRALGNPHFVRLLRRVDAQRRR